MAHLGVVQFHLVREHALFVLGELAALGDVELVGVRQTGDLELFVGGRGGFGGSGSSSGSCSSNGVILGLSRGFVLTFGMVLTCVNPLKVTDFCGLELNIQLAYCTDTDGCLLAWPRALVSWRRWVPGRVP